MHTGCNYSEALETNSSYHSYELQMGGNFSADNSELQMDQVSDAVVSKDNIASIFLLFVAEHFPCSVLPWH